MLLPATQCACMCDCLQCIIYFCYYIHIQIQDFIQPVDIAMRNLLYSMLSAEGTYKSQKVRCVCVCVTTKKHVSNITVILQKAEY